MARRLKNATDIRRYLSSLINRVESKEVDIVTAGKLGYLSQILYRVVEGSDFERRIEALEEKHKTKGGRR